MAEDHVSDSGGLDPSPAADSIGVSEAELDGVLEKAASKADDLSHELGASDSSSPAILRGPGIEEADALASDIDRQLNEIDGLLTSARHELGLAPAAPNGATMSQRTAGVPDFMREFTDVGDGLVAPEADKGNSATQVPGFMADLTMSQAAPGQSPQRVGTPGSAPSPRTALPTAPESREKNPVPTSPKSATASPATPSQIASKIRKHGSRAVAGLWGLGLTVLETLDRPVEWLGNGPRRVIGWVALGMLGLAVVVFLISRL